MHGYRITNLLVKMQGEIPILDGSAADFCALIESAGVQDQPGAVDEIVIDRRYEIGDREGGGEYLGIEPAAIFGVRYLLEYPAPVGRQELMFQFTDTTDLQARDRAGANVRLRPRDRRRSSAWASRAAAACTTAS